MIILIICELFRVGGGPELEGSEMVMEASFFSFHSKGRCHHLAFSEPACMFSVVFPRCGVVKRGNGTFQLFDHFFLIFSFSEPKAH